MNKKALTLIEIVIASMVLVTIIIYSLLAFNNVLFLSEHSSNFSLAMEGAQAILEEIKSKPINTIKSDYSGYTFDILDKSGNFLGKGRVDVEDLSGNWTKAIDSAGWAKRILETTVFDNKIWVLGGYDGSNYLNDVWYSQDGVSWVKALDNDPSDTSRWSPRANSGIVVFDNKIWVLGGYDGSNNLNDVWNTCGCNRLLKIKITCCWKEKEGRVIGEDKNLNGQLDSGEDINGNGELDSLIKLVTYIANKEFPQRIFMIEK